MTEATLQWRHAGGVTLARDAWVARLLYALVVSYPVAWLFGLAYFVWPLLTLPLLFTLIVRRRGRVPPGFGIWLLFLAWTFLSATMLDTPLRVALFGWRTSIFISATLLFLAIFNASRVELPDRTVIRAMTLLFAVVTAGGALALLFPNFSFTSPLERVLPASILADPTAHAYVHPELTDPDSRAVGYEIGRPKTFFGYTNQWGATVAVLVPFFFAALTQARRVGRRVLLIAVGLVGLAPIVISLNRGLWIAILVAATYGTVRVAMNGRGRTASAVALMIGVTVAVVVVSPLGDVAAARLNSQTNSNETRATLYTEAVDGALASPVFGWGGPRPSAAQSEFVSAHTGTQGQLWFVLYSYGFPGLAFYLAWFAIVLVRTRKARTSYTSWAHVAVLASLVILPFYNAEPLAFYIAMIAAAVAMRGASLDEEAVSPREPAPQPVR